MIRLWLRSMLKLIVKLRVKLEQMPNVKQVLRLNGVADLDAADLAAADLVADPDPAADLAVEAMVAAMEAMVEAMADMVDMEVATVDVDVGAPLTTVE